MFSLFLKDLISDFYVILLSIAFSFNDLVKKGILKSDFSLNCSFLF